jgi:hypothetical protein
MKMETMNEWIPETLQEKNTWGLDDLKVKVPMQMEVLFYFHGTPKNR